MSAESLLFWKDSPRISIVIPTYNEKDSVRELYERICQALTNEAFEVVFVDDGSSDATPEVLECICDGDHRIKIVRFARNFGKSAALAAGFRETAGEIIITMDADLQENPADIPRFIETLEARKCDLVAAWRKERNDPFTKTFPSMVFNKFARVLTGVPLHDVNCGFKAYTRDLITQIHLYGEMHRFIPALAYWKGFRITELEVIHQPRKHGRSKFGAKRFLAGFLDLFTVLFLTRFNHKPLHLFGTIGFIFFTGGLLVNLYLTYLRFMGETIGNRPLLQAGVLAMLMGVQFFSMGLLAEMITLSLARDRGVSQTYRVYRRQDIPTERPKAAASAELVEQ